MLLRPTLLLQLRTFLRERCPCAKLARKLATKIHDISCTISPALPVFPGDPPPRVRRRIQMSRGAPYNVSELVLGSHTGTHIDAPYHFEPRGKTIEKLSLDILVGPCCVVEISKAKVITRAHVDALSLNGVKRVLFKTRNSRFWGKKFHRSFTYIASDAAEALVQKGVQLVGIDYLSVEKFGSKDFATHHALLRRGIVILEGLALAKIKPGKYQLVALPLKIRGGDGSPARAILIESGITP